MAPASGGVSLAGWKSDRASPCGVCVSCCCSEGCPAKPVSPEADCRDPVAAAASNRAREGVPGTKPRDSLTCACCCGPPPGDPAPSECRVILAVSFCVCWPASFQLAPTYGAASSDRRGWRGVSPCPCCWPAAAPPPAVSDASPGYCIEPNFSPCVGCPCSVPSWPACGNSLSDGEAEFDSSPAALPCAVP